ncbi:CHASE3 domain-containing protein [Kribbella sp. NBC_00709]|uniref:sensor histidine kinase n=1 Tax=Kribbella sp. NBC_00709 TaxID=2975972 RepID=UPI002E2C87BB|nr:CHASE3 domain-containing protein [Kribbella sp. NBC_00709]
MIGGVARRVLVASGLLMVLVGSGFVVLLISVQGLRASEHQARHTAAVLTSAHQVERLVADLATGQRDFVITGQERFLQPWQAAQAQLPAQTAALQQLVASSPDELTRAQEVSRSVTSYLQDYSMPEIEAARRDPDAARTEAATAEGAQRVAQIRSVLDQLIGPEQQLSVAEQRHSDSVADQAVVAAIVGLAGSVVLILGFTIYLTRAIVRPVRVTAAMANQLAAGDLGVRVPETGVGEIRSLERTFNTMATSLGAASADVAASRARIVRSADETRRRIERDLHDGIQQRLVSLALDVRAIQAAPDAPAEELDKVADGLSATLDELREIARGIHPAILSEGGIGPALRMLARRSKVPAEVTVGFTTRLPAPIEAATYYVVSEALTNAAKHADASVVLVDADIVDGSLRLTVRDDGRGGADPANGSGLIGLDDRVQALGGTLVVESPTGAGTSLAVALPVTS